ncbi:Uncharacterised protein [Yersinia ruckeri]|nr:Uncharacterised protein [Yersinia ruckeri]
MTRRSSRSVQPSDGPCRCAASARSSPIRCPPRSLLHRLTQYRPPSPSTASPAPALGRRSDQAGYPTKSVHRRRPFAPVQSSHHRLPPPDHPWPSVCHRFVHPRPAGCCRCYPAAPRRSPDCLWRSGYRPGYPDNPAASD